MNTTVIIILGALILIVIIAIIVVLVKGKSSTDKSDDSSDITFQESLEEDTQSESPESELAVPQLHAQSPQTMEDLTAPQQSPPIKSPSTFQGEPNLNQPLQSQQGDGIYQPNPLPDLPQIENDMANLQSSGDIPTPIPTTQPNIMGDGVQNIADSINQAQEEAPTIVEPDTFPPTPTVTTSPDINAVNQGTDNVTLPTLNTNPQVTPTQQPPVSI
ncbi:MAG: hypothetical protein PHG60_01535 [Candidatus Dojkabacteria bacterium]|jgi:hypothetical protein|nr:hypothetical protein [Candidatus Dojkabacteria bacterium]